MSRVSTVCFVLAASLSGCNPVPKMDYTVANLVKATGTVTLDGQPLANAVVTFESPDDGTTANGLTKSDGSYRLMFDSQMDGVMPGKKIVRISTTKKVLGLNASEGEEGGEESTKDGGRPQELVPDKFNRKSELTEDVTASRTVYNFDLKSE